MDRANAILTGQEQATADDFIEWIEEEAFRIGSLGYGDGHANFEEVFAYLQPMKSRSEEDNEGTDLPECLAKKAMEDTHAAIVMMERKRQFMKANRPLQAMTEVRIDRELLAAGKSREDIKRYPKTEGRLRQKILDLHSLKHPLPDPPKGVDTLVVLGPKLDRRYPVSLQMDADLAEVLSFLEYICAVDDYRSQGWHKPAQHTWKYQLVTKDKKMKNAPPSTPLVSDADYQHLITQFKGMETSRAIVTLAEPPEMQPDDTLKRVTDYGDDLWNPLDEDGVPYFDTCIDFNKIKIDEKTGKFPQVDLDTVARELDALYDLPINQERRKQAESSDE